MFYLMLGIAVSYWYCLPIITQSLLGYSEIRGYDLLMLALVVSFLTTYGRRLKIFLKQDRPGKLIYQFTLWASMTYPLTLGLALLNNNTMYPFVTAVFLFHLWGFVLAYAGFRMFVKTRRDCFLMLDVFLIAGAIQGLIICFQGLGLMPILWSELYSVYGPLAFSGTLGPNRTMPGHAMLLVLVVAAAYWRNMRTVGSMRLILASTAAVICLMGLGLTGSRTAWTAAAAFALVALIGQRVQFGMIAFVLVLVVGVSMFLPESVEERLIETYEWKVSSKLSRADEGSTAIDRFQQIDSGRYMLWMNGLDNLFEKPWLIPFGGGFNNYRNVSRGASAHNTYITLVTEVGVVGLYLYMMWLIWIWRESGRLANAAEKLRKRTGASVFLPLDTKAMLAAIAVSLFGGEILYTYRPSFAFLGMFLFVCALLNHRALVFGDAKAGAGSPAERARGENGRLLPGGARAGTGMRVGPVEPAGGLRRRF